MNKVKKILMMVLSLVLVAAMSIGGTVAYLQDTDDEVNVMTLGSVKIEQNEYQRATNADGSYKTDSTGYVLEAFEQAKPLLPSAIPTNGSGWGWDTTLVDMSQVGSEGTVQVFKAGSNAQDKIVTVKNTGKSDAYVRTWIALEDPFTENRLGVNVGKKDNNYTQTPWTTVEIDGVKYSVTCFTYDAALKPGEVSTPSLFQVYLNYKATNEDMELLGDTYEILAFSQAVQAAGFDSAEAALDAAFGDNTAANHPWAGAGNEPNIPVSVSSSEGLKNALAAGKDVIVTSDVTHSTPISNDANIILGGNTFEATYSYELKDNADLTMTGGNYEVNGTYGHVDVRPSTAEGSEVVFEDVDFSFNKLGPTYGTCTDRLGSVVEVCATADGAKTVIKFKNCTFDNAKVLFEGMSGKTTEIEATFENCTFNALTSSAPIEVANYVKGTIKVVGCTFNLECTTSSASAIEVTNNPSTAVTVTAENNKINATAATPHTYDPAAGETEVDNVKVFGTPANIKFISADSNTTVNETNTTKTGIAG